MQEGPSSFFMRERFRVRLVLLRLVVLVLVISRGDLTARDPLRELPVLVTVGELRTEPDRYDGHRVVVRDRVRSEVILRDVEL